jgi:hypothetical protein
LNQENGGQSFLAADSTNSFHVTLQWNANESGFPHHFLAPFGLNDVCLAPPQLTKNPEAATSVALFDGGSKHILAPKPVKNWQMLCGLTKTCAN